MSYNRSVAHNRPELWITLLEGVVVVGLFMSIGFSVSLWNTKARLSAETEAVKRQLHIVEARREQAIAQIPVLADRKAAPVASSKKAGNEIFVGIIPEGDMNNIQRGDARVVTR